MNSNFPSHLDRTYMFRNRYNVRQLVLKIMSVEGNYFHPGCWTHSYVRPKLMLSGSGSLRWYFGALWYAVNPRIPKLVLNTMILVCRRQLLSPKLLAKCCIRLKIVVLIQKLYGQCCHLVGLYAVTISHRIVFPNGWNNSKNLKHLVPNSLWCWLPKIVHSSFYMYRQENSDAHNSYFAMPIGAMLVTRKMVDNTGSRNLNVNVPYIRNHTTSVWTGVFESKVGDAWHIADVSNGHELWA